jgi:hypothetical protein
MKKIALLSLIMLSNLVHAESNVLVQLDPLAERQHVNKDIFFESHHQYTVNNTTTSMQNISVCYDMIICPEYPYYMKSKRECLAFQLSPGQSKTGSNSLQILTSFNAQGWCHIQAFTETTGGTPAKAKDEKMFQLVV